MGQVHAQDGLDVVRPAAVFYDARERRPVQFPGTRDWLRGTPKTLEPHFINRRGLHTTAGRFGYDPVLSPTALRILPARQNGRGQGPAQVVGILEHGVCDDRALFQCGGQEARLILLEVPGRVVGHIATKEGPFVAAPEAVAQFPDDFEIGLAKRATILEGSHQAILGKHRSVSISLTSLNF